jgi:hypothetical protein
MFQSQLLPKLIVAFLLTVFTSCPVYGASPDVTQEVNSLVRSLEAALNGQEADKVIALHHPNSDLVAALKNNLQKTMEQGAMPKFQMNLLEVTEYDAGVLAKTTRTMTQPGGNSPKETVEILVLKPFNGRMKIMGTYKAPDPATYDDQSRVFSSVKGKYAVTVPSGWLPLKGSDALEALTPDAVIFLAPDLQSTVMIGFIQMPMKLGDDDAETAQKGVLADMKMEKRMGVGHQVFDQGKARIAGLDGYRVVTQFEGMAGGGVARKRMRVYLSDHPMLYVFVCDAIGPEQYDTLQPQFVALVSSFHLLPVDAGLSRREAMAAETAQGAVAGRVYTSDKFNCFIAAPEGWEIRTSPNQGHLVEMQYTDGKSIARLIASQGLPESAQLSEVVSSRIDQVKAATHGFKEKSRKDITVWDIPAIESVQTYRLEGFGKFHIKEWTLIRDNTYYLILCQCIEPDDYSVLERDFDRIFQSFGFIQDRG